MWRRCNIRSGCWCPRDRCCLGFLDVEPFDAERLVYPWRHPDAEMDALAAEIAVIAQGRGTPAGDF